MCGALKDLEDGIKSVGRSIDDGLHSAGRLIDKGTHAAVGTMAGMAFPGVGQSFFDSIGYDNKWFGKGLDLGTGIDMAAAAWFGGSQLAGMFGGQGAIPGEQFMNGMGGFGGMTGSGAQGAGAFASGSGGGIGSMFGLSGNQIGGAVDLLRGGFGLYQSNQLRKASQPSAINRQAEAELAALLADPNRITSMPGYEAGLEAVQRGMAAGGYLGSGNMATALQKYGGDFYNNALTQYGNLSQLGRGNEATYRMGGIELAGQALNSLGYGGLKLFGK
jgi:hypothetical protein